MISHQLYRQFQTTGHPKLTIEAFEMSMHRVRRHAQPLGNGLLLLVREHALGYLYFPW